jgi:hypothetical protein
MPVHDNPIPCLRLLRYTCPQDSEYGIARLVRVSMKQKAKGGLYTTMGPDEWHYSHPCRQNRFTQTWLENQGYTTTSSATPTCTSTRTPSTATR